MKRDDLPDYDEREQGLDQDYRVVSDPNPRVGDELISVSCE